MTNYSNIDIKKLRVDLKKMQGCDGLAKHHLQMSDTQLIVEFIYIYGVDALIPYANKEKEIAS